MLEKNIRFSKIATVLICSGAMVFGGCAWHKPKKEVRVWDNNNVIAQEAPMPPAPPSPPRHPVNNFDNVTNFAGCTGNLTVTDMNGNILQKGRAFNATEGLYLLDAKGRKTRNIVNSTASNSVLFQPDCNCSTNMPPMSVPHGEHDMMPHCSR